MTEHPNGAATAEEEARARVLRFVTAADDDPPERAAVERDPRPGEAWAIYVNRQAKTVQLLDHGASLTPEKQLEVARELVAWADSQHERGIAGVGAKRVLAADRLWRKRNPELKLPDPGDTGRDPAGRWVKGGGRAVAMIAERVAAEPRVATELTHAEREVVRVLAPELHAAVERYEQMLADALTDVGRAAERAQTEFPAGVPGVAVDRRATEGTA